MKKKEMDWSVLRNHTVETLEHLMDRFNYVGSEDDDDRDWIAKERRDYINDAIWDDQELWLPYLVEFDNAAKVAMRELFDHGKRVFDKMSALYKGRIVDVNASLFPSKHYSKLHPVQDRFHEMLWENVLLSERTNEYFDCFLPHLWWSTDRDPNPEKLEDIEVYGLDDDNWNEGLDRELTKDLHLSHYFHHIWECSSFAYTDFIFVREFDQHIEVVIEKDDTFK